MDSKKIMEDLTSGAQDEPQVIADIKINVEVDAKTQFLLDYTTCCLCGTDLEFTHVTNFVHHEVVEEAYCPSCSIRTKQESHRLQ